MAIPPVLPAITFFVAVTSLAWRDLRWGIYWLIITLPLNNRLLFSFGIKQLLPVRLVIYTLLLIVAGKIYDSWRKNKKLEWKKYLKGSLEDDILIVLLLLLLLRMVSLYNSRNLGYSLGLLLFYSSMIFVYLLFKKLVERHGRDFFEKVFNLYVTIATLSGIFSLIQVYYLKQYGRVLPGVWPLENEPTRFGATFWDINHYAPYLVSVIPYLLISSLFPASAKKKLTFFSAFVFLVAILGMTLSRSGWLGFALAMLILLPALLLKKLFKSAAGYLFVLTVVVSVISLGTIYLKFPIGDRLYSLTRRTHSDSVSAHAIILKGNLAVFESHPVLGGGYGSFNEHFRETKYAPRYFKYDPVEDKHLPAHSLWLETLSETGIVGFTLYFLLMGLILRTLFRAIKTSSDASLLKKNTAIFAALLGILFSGIFYSYNLEFFWVFLILAIFNSRLTVKEEKIRWRDFLTSLFLFGFAAAFIFPALGKIALLDWDESIYAEVSRNILFYKDFITLRWMRDTFWFEKPPLYFWLTSLMYIVYEVSEFSARFFSALSGATGVVVTFLLGKKIFNRTTGIVSALTLLSTVHWLFQSRNGTLDVFVATSIALSLYFFYKAREAPRNWFLTGAALGVTFMAKSAVVVIPLVTMLFFAAFESLACNKKSFYTNRELKKAVFAFLLVGLPWHLVSYIIHGRAFIDSYLFYHILERTKGIEGHGNEFFWYLTVLKVWMRHNFVLLLPACIFFIFRFYQVIRRRSLTAENVGEVFLIIWAVSTFLIFSASASKIQWYIVPIYPVLSLIIGRFLVAVSREKLVYLLILAMFISVPYAYNRYRALWDIEDANRDLAETARYMKVLTGDERDVVLLAVELASGPVMFYSERPVLTTDREGVLRYVESDEVFYALGREGDIQRIREELPEREVVILKQVGDFILYSNRRGGI